MRVTSRSKSNRIYAALLKCQSSFQAHADEQLWALEESKRERDYIWEMGEWSQEGQGQCKRIKRETPQKGREDSEEVKKLNYGNW